MANPLIGTGGGMPDMANMIKQFAAFKQAMQGRNPEQLINALISQGKMTPEQFEQLKQQASALQSILK
ncbi:MAG: hypothetical protein ACI3XQ_06455 [Eubacteriales bacterium]